MPKEFGTGSVDHGPLIRARHLFLAELIQGRLWSAKSKGVLADA
jgi:hypothetical protein